MSATPLAACRAAHAAEVMGQANPTQPLAPAPAASRCGGAQLARGGGLPRAAPAPGLYPHMLIFV